MVRQRKAVIQLSLLALMSALVTVGTLIVQIPNGMGGYFNFGDVMIFVAALTFNPFIGGIAGGLGSAMADIIGGFPVFAIATLIIKGSEGMIASLITNKKNIFRDIIGVLLAGTVMIIGYFLFEIYLWGIGSALLEIPLNIVQVTIGGLVGIPVSLVVRKRFSDIIV